MFDRFVVCVILLGRELDIYTFGIFQCNLKSDDLQQIKNE